MGWRGTAVEAQIDELLATAREALGLSVTFLTRMDGTTQHLEQVDSSVPFLFREGYTQRQDRTLCHAVQQGTLPAVMPDLRRHPEAMALPAARFPRIRSYVSVPVVLADGTTYGSFCGAGLTTDRGLGERDRALMDVLARAVAVVIEPEVRRREQEEQVRARLDPVIQQGGPTVLLQPIVALGSGERVGAEALSRFPASWGRPPDVCFAEAHRLGEGHRLELLALRGAAAHLERVPGYVSMNVSPATLVTPACAELLRELPLHRVLLELCEQDPVEDYDLLHRVLAPLRAAGLRLAIDDLGAGFSSLRHVALCAPDVVKLDRSVVAGVAEQPVLATLVASLVQFAGGLGAAVVAEGVETADDVAALHALGVGLGQGWYYDRAVEPAALRGRYRAARLGAPTRQEGAAAA